MRRATPGLHDAPLTYPRVEVSTRQLLEAGAQLVPWHGQHLVSVRGVILWFQAADLAAILFTEWAARPARRRRREVA